jgi:hypothetical protein
MGLILSPILGLLKSIPIWVWVVAAALAWGGWQRHSATATAAEFNKAKIEAAAEREKALAESIKETERRLVAQKEITQNADAQLIKAKASASAASAAATDLVRKLATIKAVAESLNTPTFESSQTSLLTDLLGSCVSEYRHVAQVADESIVAGKACEQSYNSLGKP